MSIKSSSSFSSSFSTSIHHTSNHQRRKSPLNVFSFTPLFSISLSLLLLCLFSSSSSSSLSSLSVSAAVSGYRSLDGRNNHLDKPLLGSTGSTFRRTIPARYDDNISAPLFSSQPSNQSISPRFISNQLFSKGPFAYSSYSLAAMKGAFGQAIAHDVILTRAEAESFDIPIPLCDQQLDPSCTGNRTQSFKRFLYDTSTGTSVQNPRQPLNFQSAYLDGSFVYGPDENRCKLLRTYQQGKLISDPIDGVPINVNNYPMAGHFPQNQAKQRLTGDIRGNVNPGLLALQGLFVLEHNRLCDELSSANPSWNDEILFQEARKRVIALFQIITYNEYVPSLLGTALPAYTGFNPNVDPSIDTFFGVASYRYGHSGINSIYLRLDVNTGLPLQWGHLLLRDTYFNPSYLKYGGIESILLGLTSQQEQEIDTKMVDDLRNFVEGIPHDLAAIDIQRGREVGLPTYVQARKDFGLSIPKSFADVTSDYLLQQSLQAIYGTVDKIDAWVGGLAEDKIEGLSIGPLFYSSIYEQFIRLRDGDRFFYRNLDFSAAELATLEKTKLSDVIMRNTNIKGLRANVFHMDYSSSSLAVGGAYSSASGSACALSEGGTYSSSSSSSSSTRTWYSLDSSFSIAWSRTSSSSTNSIRIALRVSGGSEGWVGFGIGTGMIGADIVICRTSNGAGTCEDYYSTDHVAPSLDSANGGTNNINFIGSTTSNGFIIYLFERPLAASDSRDSAINDATTPTSIIYAYNPATTDLQYHGAGRRGVVSLTFTADAGIDLTSVTTAASSTTTSSSSVSTAATVTKAADGSTTYQVTLRSNNFDRIFLLHGIVMGVAWAILTPFSIILARYFKSKPYWMVAHRGLMAAVGVATIGAAALAFGCSTLPYTDPHAVIGFIIVILTLLQYTFGSAIKYILSHASELGKPWLKVKMYIALLHKLTGRALLPLALAQIHLGLKLYSSFYTSNYWYLYCLIGLVLVFVYFEFQHRTGIDIMGRIFGSSSVVPSEDEEQHVPVKIVSVTKDDKSPQHKYQVLSDHEAHSPSSSSSEHDHHKAATLAANALIGKKTAAPVPVTKAAAPVPAPVATTVAPAVPSEPEYTLEEVKAAVDSGKKWLILEGFVLDVEKFFLRHPGGAYILIELMGQDITPYFKGQKEYESGELHAHGASARKTAMDLKIGKLVKEKTVTVAVVATPAPAPAQLKPAPRTASPAVQAISSRPPSDPVSHRESNEVSKIGTPSHSSLHDRMMQFDNNEDEYSRNTPVNRLKSGSISMSNLNISSQTSSSSAADSKLLPTDSLWKLDQRHHETVDVSRPVDRFRFKRVGALKAASHAKVGDNDHGVHGRTWGDWYSLSLPSDLHLSRPFTVVGVLNDSNNKEDIEIWVKRYEMGQLSRRIHNLLPNDQAIIEGPFPGKIAEFMLKDRVVMIAGGTGVLPFLDVIDYVTRPAAIAAGKVQPTPEEAMGPSSALELFGVKLVLLASFKSPKDIIARKFLTDRASCATDKFTLRVHVQKADRKWKGPTGYFKEDVFRSLIPANTQRIWVCGPPQFQASVIKLLKSVGHTKYMTM